MLDTFDLLIIFVSFSRQNYYITFFTVSDTVTYRIFTIGYFNVFSGSFRYSGFYIRDYIQGIFISRVIGCDNRKIRKTPWNLSHFKPSVPWSVTSASEQTYEPGRIVLAKCCKKTFKRHGIMCIINQKRKIIRHLYRLDPALYVSLRKYVLHRFCIYSQHVTDRNRTQSVIHGKSSGHIDPNRIIGPSAYVKFHSEMWSLSYELHVLGRIVKTFLESVFDNIACTVPEYGIDMLIIGIYYSCFALLKKHCLAGEILFKIRMFVRSYMVRLYIGKNPDIKVNSECPVKHQPLAGNFHYNRIAPAVGYLPEHLLQSRRVRGCVGCRFVLLPYYRLDGSDKPYLPACLLKYWPDKVSCCCLALGPGNTDGYQLLCGIIVMCARNIRHRRPCGFNFNYCCILSIVRTLKPGSVSFDYNKCRTCRYSLSNACMSVKIGTFYTNIYTSLCKLPVVGHKLRICFVHTAAQNFIFKVPA